MLEHSILQANELLSQRFAAALSTLFVADALAMPVHWFYNISDIERAFPGGLNKLEAAPDYHPSSIMSLHSTRAGGRSRVNISEKKPEIIGDVILKGKRQFWGQPNCHYHHGMLAGENTLNAQCARVLMRHLISARAEYKAEVFVEDYVAFMTADPPQHRDTYAESYHRGFFANFVSGLPPQKCAAITHDTPSIGGLVTIAPLVLTARLAGTPLTEVRRQAQTHLRLTHPDGLLAKICDHFVELLEALLCRPDGQDPTGLVADCARASIGVDLPALISKKRDDREIIGGLYSSACYIDGAWPGILYLLYKYHTDPRQALLINTRLGGDNVHRGSVLGALLGLVTGVAVEPWYTQLREHARIDEEIRNLLVTALSANHALPR
jgi:ADP-ribosylglycohydrolase